MMATLFIKRERRCGRMSCGHAPFMEDVIRTTLSCAITDAQGEINIILLGEGISSLPVNIRTKRKIKNCVHISPITARIGQSLLVFERLILVVPYEKIFVLKLIGKILLD